MGDPACFLEHTCFECGLMLVPADRARSNCPRCEAELEDGVVESSATQDL